MPSRLSPSSLRCVQVLASIEDGAAGPSYSVSRLSVELERNGVPTALFTVKGWRQSDPSKTGETPIGGHTVYAQDFPQMPGLSQLCLSRDLKNALWQHASDTDIIHAHGLWLMPNVYPSWVGHKSGRSVIISPRGMLGPEALRFSRLKKQAFWYLLQKSAVKAARCLHATSNQEYEEIRLFGLNNPVAVIPNGIDLPELNVHPSLAKRERTVLSLGRVHPKKGLDRLVTAWAKVEANFPDWRLRIIGPDELGHTMQLESLAAGLRLSRISFSSGLYGNARDAALQEADVFVLPTLNENFGMVAAEALAAGTPVISTRGAPWSGLVSRKCGWWIDAGVEPLSAALAEAMATPRQTLEDMGSRGRKWMAQDFSWHTVTCNMLEVYRWLTSEGEMPRTVRLK